MRQAFYFFAFSSLSISNKNPQLVTPYSLAGCHRTPKPQPNAGDCPVFGACSAVPGVSAAASQISPSDCDVLIP
jgi:hypothetical protein